MTKTFTRFVNAKHLISFLLLLFVFQVRADSGFEHIFFKIKQQLLQELSLTFENEVATASITFSCPNGILTNPDFESNLTGWQTTGSTTSITTNAFNGTKAIIITGNDGGVQQAIAATPGNFYSYSMYGKRTGTAVTTAGLEFYDSSWGYISGEHYQVTSTSWEYTEKTKMAPANAAYVMFSGRSNSGSGNAYFDSFCTEEWSASAPSCANNSCALAPNSNDVIMVLDESGDDTGTKEYDNANLILCDNGDGTLSIKGNIINGQDAYWDPANATNCGLTDGWIVDILLSDLEVWTQFMGPYEQGTGCAANHVDWDYWEMNGTFTGIGCNAGRTLTVFPHSNGYKLQIGTGGNSQSCNFGMSTWFHGSEGNKFVHGDIYAHLDLACYNTLRPTEICDNNKDDDGDGLKDCYDPDCGGNVTSVVSVDVPKAISATVVSTITSTIEIASTDTIVDVNLIDLNVTHTYIDDIKISLTSPNGTTVLLMDQPCGGENNIDIDLDDEAATGAWSCPPVNGLAYQPGSALSAFDGVPANGTWTLSIEDVYGSADGGSLDGWSLEIETLCNLEICNDGIDNDGDGLVDDNDPDCHSCGDCVLWDAGGGLVLNSVNGTGGIVSYDSESDWFLCENSDGSVTVKGNFSGAYAPAWASPGGTPCGGDDGWFINATLFDKQTWDEFGGTYLASSVGCSDEHLDWTYWDFSGYLVGTGCNTGTTVEILGSNAGYRVQLGENANNNYCGFGFASWFEVDDGGTIKGGDLYARYDETCFDGTPPEEICGDGIDNDGDGFIDEADSDCIDSEYWLEAECAIVGANWTTVANNNASDDTYVTIASGLNSYNNASTLPDDWLTFTFDVAIAGNYSIFGRVITPSFNDDSFWVRANGGTWYLWNSLGDHNSWTWLQMFNNANNNALLSLPLTAGSNTIDIAYREDGALLDKIYLSTDGALPTGEGETASNCTTTEICNDGIDNDNDNLVDDLDPDCSCQSSGMPNIDFNFTPTGMAVSAGANPSELWAAYGLHISTDDPSNHPLMMFSSTNPTGGDWDLGTPNEDFGGEGFGDGGSQGTLGENSEGLGNLLIIADNSNTNNPSDYVGGGTVSFNFDNDVDISAIEIVDVDHGNIDGTVKVFDSANNLITENSIIAYGNNSYQKVAINALGARKMEVTTSFSFSIASLLFCDTDLPTASIGDLVWSDINADGNAAGEEGIENIKVSLYNDNSNLLAIDYTNASGLYQFENLVDGTYRVDIDEPSGYDATYDLNGGNDNDSGEFTISNGEVKDDVDFGLYDTACDDFAVNLSLSNNNICYYESSTITATASGGDGSYSYAWTNVSGTNSTYVVTPETTTTYSVTVTDGYGCSITDMITLTIVPCAEICGDGIDNDNDTLTDCDDPDCSNGLSVNLALSNNNICYYESSTVTATASGGDGNYSYSWTNISGTNNAYGVTPGATTTYTVTVTDGTGCSTTDAITLTIVPCAEICDDGIDNDNDGLTDCDDPDCAQNIWAGKISGDEEFCTSYNAVTIVESKAMTGIGVVTYQWEQSTDQSTWTVIAGATGIAYDPGTINATTFYRRKAIGQYCEEAYSNTVRKVVDATSFFCLEEPKWELGCDASYVLSALGVGIKGVDSPKTRVLNPTLHDLYLAEAVFSGGAESPDFVTFTNEDGITRTANKIYFEGESGVNGNRYFQALLPPSDSIFLEYEGDTNTAESLIAHTVNQKEDLISFGEHVHQAIAPGQSFTYTYPLPEIIDERNIYISIPFSGMEDNGTELNITLSANGVSKTETINSFAYDNSLNIHYMNIKDVPNTATNVVITIASPSANGQNALIHGAVSGSAKCDDGLVLLIDSEADCPGVGDTIDFTYTLINFEDYYIDYLGGTSMLFGSLDFGTDTILANSQLVKDTFYIVTESDLPGPVFDSLRYAGYNFFENGVKPIWDIGKESASLFEVDFSMTASTDSVLIGETVVFDYFIKNRGTESITIDLSDFEGALAGAQNITIASGDSLEVSNSYTIQTSDLPSPLTNNANLEVTSTSGCNATLQESVVITILMEVCDDGIDNVGDGLVDCEDPSIWDVCCIPDEWSYDCGDDTCVELVGIGIKDNVPATITFTDTSTIQFIVIEATFDGGSNSPDVVEFASNSGFSYDVDEILFTNSSDKYFQAYFGPTSSITMTPEAGSAASRAETMIAYVFRDCEKTGSSGKFVHQRLSNGDSYTFDFTVPTSTVERDIDVSIPLSELTNDGRIVNVSATAGTVTNSIVVDNYNVGNSLNITPFTLYNVPGNVDVVSVTVSVPTVNGQSLYLSGAGSVNVICPDLVYAMEVDNNCSSVGETINYTHTITNAGDTDFTNLSLIDTYFGAISLGTSTLGVGQTITITDSYTVQSSDFPGPISNDFTLTGEIGNTGVPITVNQSANISLFDVDFSVVVDTTLAKPGDIVAYTYTVSNNGSETINYTIDDDKAGAITPGNVRASDRLQAFYDFNEGSGFIVSDKSGVSPAMDLFISNTANTSWLSEGLAVNASTIIQHPSVDTKLRNACQLTNEITLEVWIKNNNLTQSGPARIMTLSEDSGDRSFTLGQAEDEFETRLRTTTSTNNGTPAINSANGTATTNLQHVIFTRDVNGLESIYVDGVLDDTNTKDGDFSNWGADYFFGFANEFGGDDRTWLGELYLGAVYSKALSQTEVTQNYNAGSEGIFYIIAPGETITHTGTYTIQPDDMPNPVINTATLSINSSNGCTEMLTENITILTCFDEICDNGIDDDCDGLTDCEDEDCSMVSNQNFNAFCPGIPYEGVVTHNYPNTTFTIINQPANATATIENNGSFVLTPNGSFCATSTFTYTFCNVETGCCSDAMVTVNYTDTVAPTLQNVPTNDTVFCDEIVPLPPFIQVLDNCPAISLGLEEASTQGEDGCSLHDYSLTRTWTATDACGNTSAASQQIEIIDATAPDLFRIHVLPNGKRLVAGVMENMTQRWKTVQLPIDFEVAPVIFTQVSSQNQQSAVTVRMRNVSTSQFEMKLQEEAANDGKHGAENVSWIAVEAGGIAGEFEIGIATGDSDGETHAYNQPFSFAPGLITSMMTTLDSDAAVVRYQNSTATSVQFVTQEEDSDGGSTEHQVESIGYWAIADNGDLKNLNGEVIGEKGKGSINHNNATFNFSKTYHNPVVLVNSLGNGDADPVTVRVTNVTSTGFDVYAQEWDYQDGIHGNESIGWIVMEGSLPLNSSVSCDAIPEGLELGTELIAVDNCDVNVAINETEVQQGANCFNQKVIRTYVATDECGNTTSLSYELTLTDDVLPDFTVPNDVTLTCSQDVTDLSLTGDVTDEVDNCATNLEATYVDDNSNLVNCSGFIQRGWSLTDDCGNTILKNQNIHIFDDGDRDGDGSPDVFDLDADNDGIPNVDETDIDSDNDGIANYLDLDSDNDGIPDVIEAGFTDINGDGEVDNVLFQGWDDDNDGFADGYDANDMDASLAASDNFDAFDLIRDVDQDGVPNMWDLDSDNDGVTDLIEAGGVDTNGDGVIDYPVIGNPFTMIDLDFDGFCDTYDSDDDGAAGIDDLHDPLLIFNGSTFISGKPGDNPDTDLDYIPDYLDLDSDNDGLSDLLENGGIDENGDGTIEIGIEFADTNSNGYHDDYEANPLIKTDQDGIISDGRPEDTNADGTPYIGTDLDLDFLPNYKDVDADGDGIFDLIEVGNAAIDLNNDGVLDALSDANQNGFDDNIEVSQFITTESDGLTNDGRPEDSGVDPDNSPYNTTQNDGTLGDSNGEPDVDNDGDGWLNCMDADSDNDGLLDAIEDTNLDGNVDPDETNAFDRDTDNDLIIDGIEDANQNGIFDIGETDALNPNTDGDPLDDGEEDANKDGDVDAGESDPRDPCDPYISSACEGVVIDVKVKLLGAMLENGGGALMRDNLRTKGYLPTLEPYTELPTFEHVAEGGSEYVENQIFDVTGNNAIVDWVVIELRDPLDAKVVVATRSGLLQRDGDVVDIDGVSFVTFEHVLAGDYFVSVRHRNHLGIMTKTTRLLSPIVTTVDFIDASTEVYDEYSRANFFGEKVLWAGDMDSDGQVIYQGPGNDIFDLITTVLLDPENVTNYYNFITKGYYEEDLNMDGNVIFQGPDNDRGPQLFQVILNHEDNDLVLPNFIVKDGIPD